MFRTFGWALFVLAALLLAGCGDTSGDGGPHSTSDVSGDTLTDTVVLPPGACTVDTDCSGTKKCVNTDDESGFFFCGEANEGGTHVGLDCTADTECELNSCVDNICVGPPDPDAPKVLVGTGGTCSWVDSPEDCLDWKCYYDSGMTICRHNDQSVPNGNVDWTCLDSATTSVCTYTGEVTNTGGAWSCNYSAATNTTSCTQPGDLPDEQLGWICEYPAAGGGTVKVCERAGGNPAGPGCDAGNVEGYACTPSLDGVSGATVTISYTDCDGAPAQTSVESDSLGYFVLANIPVGSWSLSIEKGPYAASTNVTIESGSTTSFTDGDPRTCFDPNATKIAVVGGSYDAIEVVLDELGFEYDIFNGANGQAAGLQFLLDASAMSQYDIIFINCGVAPESNFANYLTEVTAAGQNIKNFVEGGGYIYASDWAYFFVEYAFPDKIDFRGGDLTAEDVLSGAVGNHAVAVTDPELQAYTGINVTTIFLDLDYWAIAKGVASDVRVYLRGDAKVLTGEVEANVPFLVDFRAGAGSAAYTSYHIHENDSVNDFFAFIALNFK